MRDESGIRVFTGSGDGSFREPVEIFFDTQLSDLGFGDMDRDGLLVPFRDR